MKKIYALSVVLLVCFGVLALSFGPLSLEKRQEKASSEVLLPAFSFEEIEKIVITQRGGEIAILTKAVEGEARQWISELPTPYEAEARLIEMLHETMSGMKRETVISRNPEKAANFEVTETLGLKFSVLGESGKPLTEFIIGKAGSKLGSRYVRRTDENNVYEITGLVMANIERSGVEWRKRDIFAAAERDAKTIVITDGKKEVVLEKGEAWSVKDLENQDAEKVAARAKLITDLFAIEFADGKDPKETGFNEKAPRVKLIFGEGQEVILSFGSETESGRFAKRSDKNNIFLVNASDVKEILGDVSTLTLPEKK